MRNINNPALPAKRLVFGVIVGQEQPVLSGTRWSSFVHRQMSLAFCLQRFQMEIDTQTQTQKFYWTTNWSRFYQYQHRITYKTMHNGIQIYVHT